MAVHMTYARTHVDRSNGRDRIKSTYRIEPTQRRRQTLYTHKQGALAAVLGFPLQGTTIGTHYSEGHRVRLTVHVGQAPDPTEAQLVKVAEVCENCGGWGVW